MGMLLAACLALLGLAGCHDSSPPMPTISVQPTDATALAGSSATFSVGASGPDISYQWQAEGDGGTWIDLQGATGSSYTTPALAVGDSGRRYRVVVSAAGIEVHSTAVTLTVTAAGVAPVLSVAPASIGVIAPAHAVFSVTAAGSALHYQWQRSGDGGVSWADIVGAVDASHDAGPTDVSMNGLQFRVVVSNDQGSVTSATATLGVEAAPATPQFTTQPADQAVTAGSAAAFSVAATGTPAPTLQWQRSVDGGASWVDIAGATADTYNTGPVTLSQDGERYRARAANGTGIAASNVAILSVSAAAQAPVITLQPSSQAVTAPATATFAAAASGVPTPTWQWQQSTDGGVSFSNINGATGASYTTPATVALDDGKRFRAIATNSVDSAATSVATLTVSAQAAQWRTPQALSSPAGYFVGGARVAAGAEGRFIAAWLAYDPPNKVVQVRVSRHATATGWSAPEVAASWSGSVGDNNRSLAVGMAPDGTAVLAWLAPWEGRASVFASRQSPGGAWSGPALLENVDGGDARNVALAVDGQGAATVVWNQVHDAFNELATVRVLAARQGTDGAWTPPVDIDLLTGGNGNSVDPFVAANATGDVVVAWTTSNATGQFATANTWRQATGWGVASVLTPVTLGNNSVTEDVGINDAGLAVVAMHRLDSGTRSILLAQDGGAGWAAAVEVDQTSDSSMEASLAVAPDGGVHVAFRRDTFSGFNHEIWTTSRAGLAGAWTAPVLIGATSSSVVRLRSDGDGNVVAAWNRNASSANVVESARRTAAGVWSAVTVIEAQTAVNSTFLWHSLAVSPNGHAAAAWVEGINDASAAWVNVYR